MNSAARAAALPVGPSGRPALERPAAAADTRCCLLANATPRMHCMPALNENIPPAFPVKMSQQDQLPLSILFHSDVHAIPLRSRPCVARMCLSGGTRPQHPIPCPNVAFACTPPLLALFHNPPLGPVFSCNLACAPVCAWSVPRWALPSHPPQFHFMRLWPHACLPSTAPLMCPR
jgi:hypothetical protein